MSDRNPPTPAPLLGCGDDALDDLLREVAEDPPFVPVTEDRQPCVRAKPVVSVADTIARMQLQAFEFPRAEALEPLMTSSALLADSGIIARLRELQQTMIGSRPDPRDYVTTRDEVCALNVVFNQRKAIAPALRPYKRAAKPNEKGRFFTDRWVIGDRMVIDMHWLWTVKMNVPSLQMRAFFEAPDFSFIAASEFARARMTMGNKANAVGLSEVALLLTTSFRSPPIRDRLRTVDGQLQALRRVLLDRRHSKRYRLTAAAIEELHSAAHALLVARGSPTVASEVVIHVGGAPVGPDRMRDIKKRLGTFGMGAGSWGENCGA